MVDITSLPSTNAYTGKGRLYLILFEVIGIGEYIIVLGWGMDRRHWAGVSKLNVFPVCQKYNSQSCALAEWHSGPFLTFWGP